MRDPQEPSKLGSLAQSARKKQLNQARILLFVAGVLIVIGGALDLGLAKSIVDKAVKDEFQNRRIVPTPAQVQEATNQIMKLVYLIDGGLIGLGVLFIIFGFMVKQYPVPITVISLVLFVGMIAIMAVINPATLVSGWWIKLIVVIGLVKALQSAIAYQREQAQVLDMEPEL
jgi:hypothetical protein